MEDRDRLFTSNPHTPCYGCATVQFCLLHEQAFRACLCGSVYVPNDSPATGSRSPGKWSVDHVGLRGLCPALRFLLQNQCFATL